MGRARANVRLVMKRGTLLQLSRLAWLRSGTYTSGSQLSIVSYRCQVLGATLSFIMAYRLLFISRHTFFFHLIPVLVYLFTNFNFSQTTTPSRITFITHYHSKLHLKLKHSQFICWIHPITVCTTIMSLQHYVWQKNYCIMVTTLFTVPPEFSVQPCISLLRLEKGESHIFNRMRV